VFSSSIIIRRPFSCRTIPDVRTCYQVVAQGFYVYDEDGSHRRENITDWALEKFQKKYGAASGGRESPEKAGRRGKGIKSSADSGGLRPPLAQGTW